MKRIIIIVALIFLYLFVFFSGVFMALEILRSSITIKWNPWTGHVHPIRFIQILLMLIATAHLSAVVISYLLSYIKDHKNKEGD
jgi:ABC-type multidrug transport system permease subunit